MVSMPLPWKKERFGSEIGPELKGLMKQLLKEAKKMKDKADLSEQFCRRLLTFPEVFSSCSINKPCQDLKGDVAHYFLHGSHGPKTLCAFACWLLEDFSVFLDSEVTKRLLLEACIGTVGILTSMMPHCTSSQIYSIVTSSPRLMLAMGKFINHVHLLGYGGNTPNPLVKEMHAAVYICLGFLFYGVKASELHRSMSDDVSIRLEQLQADSHQILDRDMRFLIQAILLSINCPKKYPYTNFPGHDVSHMCHIVASMNSSQVYTCTIPKLTDYSSGSHTPPLWTTPILITASDVCSTLSHMQSICKPAGLVLAEPRILHTICMLLHISSQQDSSEMAHSCCALLLHMLERCKDTMMCALQLCSPTTALLDALRSVYEAPVCHDMRHTITSLLDSISCLLESGKAVTKYHTNHSAKKEKSCGICSLFSDYFQTIKQFVEQERDMRLYILPALNSIPLELRADLINIVENDESLLSCAAASEQYELTKALIEKFGVNLERVVRTRQGEFGTVIHLAVDFNSLKLATILLNNGANVNSVSSCGDRPLSKACAAGNMEMVWLLLRYKADVNKAGLRGKTPLMMSASSDGDQVARALLRFDAAIKVVDDSGNTALHYAAKYGNSKMFEVILVAGCNAMALNFDKDHALAHACVEGQEEMVNFLFNKKIYPAEWKAPAYALLGTYFAGHVTPPKIAAALKCWSTSLKYLRKYPNVQWHHSVSDHVFEGIRDICVTESDRKEEVYERVVGMVMESLYLRESLLGKSHPRQLELMHLSAKHIHTHEYFTDTMKLLQLAMKRGHDKLCLNYSSQDSDLLPSNTAHSFNNDNDLKCLQDISYLGHLAYKIAEVTDEEDVKEMLECCMAALDIAQNHGHFLYARYPPEVLSSSPHMCTVIDRYFEGILGLMNCALKLTVEETREYRSEAKKTIEGIINEDMVNSSGRSLLHVTLKCGPRSSEEVPVGRCTDYYPNPQLVEMLLECGADVNKPDNQGDTPLHVCTQQVQRHLFRAASGDLRQCIQICLKYKPHLDFRNHSGDRVVDELAKIDKQFLGYEIEINLQCLSAVCILKYNLPYIDYLPERLKTFVRRH